MLLVQAEPALAATKVKDNFTRSQEEAALFEKLIRERGGGFPSLKLPSAPAVKQSAKEESEEYTLPKPVELKSEPLKLGAPPRRTKVPVNPRVPEPEPAKPGEVAAEGVVQTIGGDVPPPPPAPERKPKEAPAPAGEAPKPFFNFPSLPKAEELPKPSLPSLPTPAQEEPKPFFTLPAPPKAQELPKPSLPSLPSLPSPEPAAKVHEAIESTPAPTPPPTPPQEVPKAFGGFFSGMLASQHYSALSRLLVCTLLDRLGMRGHR